ncbi:RHS repeat domain-containing protein [Marinicella sediminis]|uniref:RHS repeat domain-containing protein n=1 Tax=Marinicella sediminis TaxID=1792834 RepID=A0ABV7JFU6_9GAMM|nr:RHS repeat-associated core domain-containing protein [Marinicella sediminis]
MEKVGNRCQEIIDTAGAINARIYVYNDRDQLTSITVGTAQPHQYEYDYAGQRVKATSASGNEKRYLYDGLTLIAETNAIGNTLATYHYGARRQLAETRNGQRAYYLADALGTNVAITNQDGSIQNRMDYDVWGNLNQETSTSDSPFGFTGYLKDEDTDLYYANARYYDSFTGRFLREDPLFGNTNEPPSLHRYMYAASNPTAWIDPTGKGNDTPHFYESLLLGDVVQLSIGHNLAFALGAQIGDEFKQHDAINNSISYGMGMINYSVSASYGFITKQDVQRIRESREKLEINNCGAHALCGDDPILVRNAFVDYAQNEAENIAQYGTADHAFTDSFYHIDKKTLRNKVGQKSHKPDLGHLFEGTSTDKAFRYHRNKRIVAFEQRAIELYKYSVRNGLTTLSPEEFGLRLSEATNLLNQKNRELMSTHMEYGLHGSTFPHNKADFDAVNPNHEFYYMQEIMKERGYDNIPSTQIFEASHNIFELLNGFSKNQLQEIAKVMNPNAVHRINEYDKERLITYISYRFDQYQTKSKKYIYQNVKQQQADQVIESKSNPGIEEVSQ